MISHPHETFNHRLTRLVLARLVFVCLLGASVVAPILHAPSAPAQDDPVVSSAKDVVHYRSDKSGQPLNRTGTIEEFTGKALLLKVSTGNQISIATSSVIDVETAWSTNHRLADQLFAQKRFPEALAAYTKAILEDDQPQWILRRLMARRVLCHQALQDTPRAVEDFMRIVDVDPATQYFAAIPLNWQTRSIDTSLEKMAQAWLTDKSAVLQLIGSSWLLSTASRRQAEVVLKDLAIHSDERIAYLAAAQLWRTTGISATADDIAKWPAIIDRMPPDLRAGPLYVCGSWMLKQKADLDSSLLLLLKVSLLYDDQYQLAADCLWQSAKALAAANRYAESEVLCRDLIKSYSSTEYGAAAQSFLQEIKRIETRQAE
jgi:tetratricopeptide (TPR) repeat protein